MKSKLLQAASPQDLEKVLNDFLASDDPYFKAVTDRHNLTGTPGIGKKECENIINVQQYITQIIEQNKFDPRAGQQTITYYLLIIYR